MSWKRWAAFIAAMVLAALLVQAVTVVVRDYSPVVLCARDEREACPR